MLVMKSITILKERSGLGKVCFILFLSHSLSPPLVATTIDFFIVMDGLFDKKKKGYEVVLMINYQDRNWRSRYVSLGLSMRWTWLCG